MNKVSLLRRNANYRNLWLAQMGSAFGDWFNQVALAQVTLTLTHSSTSMGLVLLCRSLPSVLLGPFVAPFVDLFPKKSFLIVTDVIRAVLALGYIFVVVSNQQWMLYVNSLLLGIFGVLFPPARQASLSFVVDRDDLVAANSIDSFSGAAVQIVGASLGGVVAATVSPTLCFVINSASYIWSFLHIFQSRWSENVSRTKGRQSYFAMLSEGYREATENTVVRTILLIGIGWGLAGGGYYILLRLLGIQVFHMGGIGVGILYVIDGLGVLVGAYLVKHYVKSSTNRASFWYGFAYITQALFFALLTLSTSFVLGAAFLFLMRASSGIIIPLDNYLLQISTSKSVRGRVFALHGSTYGGVMQLSYVITGVGFQSVGIPLVGSCIGGVSLLCGVYWFMQHKGSRILLEEHSAISQ